MSTLSLRSLSMLIKYYRRPVLTLFAITGAGIALAALSKLAPLEFIFPRVADNSDVGHDLFASGFQK